MMIWIVILALCIAVFSYLALPLYLKKMPEVDNLTPENSPKKAYHAELLAITTAINNDEGNKDALIVQKNALEKRLIESASTTPRITTQRQLILASAIFLILTAGTFSLYAKIGSPQLTTTQARQQRAVLSTPQALSQNTKNIEHENNASMEDLVGNLERKLKVEGGTLQQWGLYARSLMTIGRYDDAFKAYEKTLSLSDNNPQIAAELKSARAFAAQQIGSPTTSQPGPNQEDIDAAAQMNPSDRADMIQGMVEGLATKLSERPNDPSGWVRLLRARKVLGQTEQANIELTSMKAQFSEKPEVIAQILTQSGWDK